MSRQEALEQYNKSLKLGQKYYKASVNSGRYPYTQSLDEIFDESMAVGRAEIGIIDIPMDRIVGPKISGRQFAFAGNFMPLLDADSEFGSKWIRLCEAHLGDEGIRDAIRCYEYMGRFYVQEGNKRVSVLKSYGNPSITGYVTRIIPAYSEDPEVQVYYEFMHFYKLAGIYEPQFRHAGSYEKLQAALGFEPDHVWTEDERRRFLAGYTRLKEALRKRGDPAETESAGEVLLIWLEVYSFADLLNKMPDEIVKNLTTIRAEIDRFVLDKPITVSTVPPEPSRGVISVLQGLNRPSRLHIAFIYTASPEQSPWMRAHEQGRTYLLEKMGENVTADAYLTSVANAEKVMEQAIGDGAEILFAVTPTLMAACRKTAALYPHVKILDCSLSMPYPGVRTYYSRIYEAKFVAGVIAGAMTQDGRIGYIADYPIFGVPASINAFTLGALAVNPRAKVTLRWSCKEENAASALHAEGIRIVSRQESGPRPRSAWEWGLYETDENGTLLPLASPCWNWGKFYVKMVRSVFNGAWANAAQEEDRAVNYWWGLNSGVIDVKLSDTLPDGVSRLAAVLRRGISEGNIEPFHCYMRDQVGIVRNTGEHGLPLEEIMNMDWLLDCVDGFIPAFDELREESKGLVRILGIYRDHILPEKEETQL